MLQLASQHSKVTERAILAAGLEDTYKKLEKLLPASAALSRPPLDAGTTSLLKQYSEEMVSQVVGLLHSKIDKHQTVL